MNPEHHSSLQQYVNDMIGLERDIANAIKLQLDDERVKEFTGLPELLTQIVTSSERRCGLLKQLSTDEGASLGAAFKEGVTAVTGTLVGIYGKFREHPVSRMVRDDVIAMDVSVTAYSMLVTLGLAIGHDECTEIASEGLNAAPPFILKLTDLLPLVVATELAKDAPLAHPGAAQIAQLKIREAWKSPY